jgi:pheromone shutdown protein TraB
MLAAIEAARKTGARVALVDREVGITIQRFWSAMGFLDNKIKLFFTLVPAALGWDDEDIDMQNITKDVIVSQMISEFQKVSPSAANVLVDERDAYIAGNLCKLSKRERC